MTYHVSIICVRRSPLRSLFRFACHAFILEHPRPVPCPALALANLQIRIHLIAHMSVGGRKTAF